MAVKLPVLDPSGKKVADRELPAAWFEASVNVSLMHQAVVAGLAAARSGTHATKTRGEVSGGGRKPWRQKGTGRARHGSIRSPQWVGGGVAHGPKPRSHDLRVNKKMKRGALRSAMTDALQSGKLALVTELAFDEPRTKRAQEVLDALELDGKVLLVLPEPQDAIERSFRNLRHVRLTYARSLSVYEVLAADRVLLTQAALETLEALGAPGASGATEQRGTGGGGPQRGSAGDATEPGSEEDAG